MPPNAIDVKHLLEFFRDMYAHTLTLQDLIAHDDERQYEDVRQQYDRQAENGFALLFRSIDDPAGFSAAVKAFREAHSTPGKIQ